MKTTDSPEVTRIMKDILQVEVAATALKGGAVPTFTPVPLRPVTK